MKKAVFLLTLLLTVWAPAATVYFHVTVSGAGAKDGAAWASAMDLAAWVDHMTNTVATDTYYFVQAGTYTLTGNFASTRAGTTALPIRVVGVLATTTNEGASIVPADYAYTTNRPLIAAGSNTTNWSGGNWKFLNLECSTATTNGFQMAGVVVDNCYFHNTSTAATGHAFYGYGTITNSRFSALDGDALYVSNPALLKNCHIYGSVTGVYAAYSNIAVLGCAIHSCSSAGIDLQNRTQCVISNNTIIGNKIGITGTSAAKNLFANNIIAYNVTGASWSTANELTNMWFYNDFYSNSTADRSNVTAGATDVTGNPYLTCTVGRATDGASTAGTKVFTSATAPFASVTTSDLLVIFSGTGTGIKLQPFTIASVDSTGQLTLDVDPTNGSQSISSVSFAVVKGRDFRITSDSTVKGAGMGLNTNIGITGTYRWNIGVDQNDVVTGGSTTYLFLED